ncbi:accessory factor UbiK family protein [Oryzibacter oryziterrae]|uniref:accessory factor UbiK family protein n=1 Tax=Oryzibacter oryziterrae TaxID=2766474 RepID=UPI001F3B722D|nr:accessory factor UbiK family protein [Oryzibacter oryziterrae]
MTVSREEFDALKQLVVSQQQTIARLEAQLDRQPENADVPISRRGLFTGVAAAAAGAVAGLAGTTNRAEAATGDALVAGSYYNVVNHPTSLTFTGGATYKDYAFGVNDGYLDKFQGAGTICANVTGLPAAIYAEDLTQSGRVGIFAFSKYGRAIAGSSETGIGIQGYGSVGVYGLAANSGGVGVSAYGDSQINQTALKVDGVARMSRSGLTTVKAGQKTATVAVTQLKATAMVFATIQTATSGVSVARVEVKTTSPSSFKIVLTGNAPAGGAKVAWVIFDRL